jgi:predicted nucleic acid-binding Zn ribbon protein
MPNYTYYCLECDHEHDNISHTVAECDKYTAEFKCEKCGGNCRRKMHSNPFTFLELGVNY